MGEGFVIFYKSFIDNFQPKTIFFPVKYYINLLAFILSFQQNQYDKSKDENLYQIHE
jgi:hypothetical protein